MNMFRIRICLNCYEQFQSKKEYKEHKKNFSNHHIIQEDWKGILSGLLARLLNFVSWERLCKTIGVLILYYLILNHFNIELSWKESSLVGIALGLIL